jgi:transposase
MAKVRRQAAEWARLIDQWRQSGLSLPAFCRRHGLKRGTMQNWVYKPSLRRAAEEAGRPGRATEAPPPGPPSPPAPSPAFLPIRIAGVVASPMPERADVEVVIGPGRRIAVGPGFDPETLRRVVAVLEGRSC